MLLTDPLRSTHRTSAAPEPISMDVVISRFEPLLVHAPRNIKVIKTLAEAYARKMMFDRLSPRNFQATPLPDVTRDINPKTEA